MRTIILSWFFILAAMGDEKIQPTGYYFGEKNPKVNIPKSMNLKQFKPFVSTLPDRDMRDKIFSEAKLDNELKKYDEVERDILFHHAKVDPINELIKNYPEIAPEKMTKLKELIK